MVFFSLNNNNVEAEIECKIGKRKPFIKFKRENGIQYIFHFVRSKQRGTYEFYLYSMNLHYGSQKLKIKIQLVYFGSFFFCT